MRRVPAPWGARPPAEAPGVAARTGAAAALAAATVLAACGGDQPDDPAAPPPERGEAPARTSEEATEAGGGGGAPESGRGRGAQAPGPDGVHGPERCVFTAPEGRLARAEVAIELDGVSCAEATPLARAAALGQPAGANLTIESRGFECEPSSADKGANVRYTCTGGSGSASFDVVWSEPGG